MTECRVSAWIAAVDRLAGVCQALVVHGNVGDLCRSPESGDYLPVAELVARRLKLAGYDEVVTWDRYTGIHASRPEVLAELSDGAVRCLGTPTSSRRQAGGTSYDFGGATNGGPAPSGAGATVDPADFFSMVHGQMLKPTRRSYAFVVNWSDLLFGSATALSEVERQWLLVLSKGLRDSPAANAGEGLNGPPTALVLLCGKSTALPVQFSQGNPAVREVLVPRPTRTDRDTYVRTNIDLWCLHNPLVPGSVDLEHFVDSLEGYTIRELLSLLRLSRKHAQAPLTWEQIVTMDRYGERRSPWEELNRQKLKELPQVLRQRVKGQDEAIETIRKVIIRAFTGLSGLQHSRKQQTPKGVLFFVGPTGVGKTELAKALAKFLFGDDEACIRFDMSEFNHEHSDQRLVGAPPGYVGHENGGQLTGAVKSRPFSVLLFDEIEKAHPRVLDKFLQILEDGRLTDGRGDTVSFAETVIIFTSNIGSAEIASDQGNETTKASFIQAVRHHFVNQLGRPELLNRIGNNIVPFNFLVDDGFLIQIAKAKLLPLRERLREKYRIEDLYFIDEDKALGALVRTVNRSHGGRGVLNQLVTHLWDPLAEFLFEEEEQATAYVGRRITVLQAGDTPSFAFKLE